MFSAPRKCQRCFGVPPVVPHMVSGLFWQALKMALGDITFACFCEVGDVEETEAESIVQCVHAAMCRVLFLEIARVGCDACKSFVQLYCVCLEMARRFDVVFGQI